MNLDILALAVGLLGVHIFVELVNQAEDGSPLELVRDRGRLRHAACLCR